MVKNIPAIERSTEIRFGKHVPDSTDQADNTIVFNASNVLVPTPYSNAVYLSPIRNRPDYTPPEVVLLMYDRNTKEITESGESANTLVGGVTFGLAVNRSNVTSNTVVFTGGGHDFNNVGFVTDSNVGLSNLLPQHTVSIGSNLYVDDTGSNVLVISGNVAVLRDMVIDGNLRVNGDTTVIYTENTSIKDAFIELGRDNTSGDTTLDLGVLMHRPDALSNVVIGYREGNDEFAIAYTDAQPTDKTFTPKTDEDINVHVYGLTHVDANIYAHEDVLVDGNVSVAEELTISNNVYAQKDLEVVGNVYVDGNVVAYKDLLVSGNVTVTEELTISNNVYAQKDLEVMGNVYVDGNVVAYKDLLVSGNVSVTEELTISNNVYAQKDLEVMGNVYVDGNVVAYKDLLVSGNVTVTEELTIGNNVYAQKDLEVVGNVYVDGNVVAYKDLLVSGNVTVTKQLSVSGNAYVSGNVEVTKSLIVSANTHLKGPNVFVTNTMNFLNPNTAIVTDQVSNVQIRLGQLANVVIGGKALASEDMLVYDGSNWTNQLQNHTFLYAKAEEVIDKGDVVYATGTIGNNMFSIRKARSDSSTTMPALGVAYQAFTLNQEGLIVTFGRADGIDTDNFQTGETVYVSNVTAGALSNVKPYGPNDLIQNVGLVVKGNSNGIVNVTGVGRSNDIPNAPIVADEGDINYVYVNDANNDLKKILPTNLLTQLQTLQQVTDTGNTTSNTIQFTNTTTGIVTTSNIEIGSNISVAGLTDATNKHVPMVGTDGFLQKSSIYFTPGGKYVVSAAEAEFFGNLILSGNTSIISSNNVTIEDRIFGIGANNEVHNLDTGIMMEHKDNG